MPSKPFVNVNVDDLEVLQMLAKARLRQDPLLRRELVEIGGIVEGHLKAKAPRSKNHRGRGKPLADSFATRSFPTSVVVRSYKPYAAIMEAGGTTPPHEIKPKKAHALAFSGSGSSRKFVGWYVQKQFARSVHHPGAHYAGKHFAAQVAREDGELITAKLAAAVTRSFN